MNKLSKKIVMETVKRVAGYACQEGYYLDEPERHNQKSAISAMARDHGMSRATVYNHISVARNRYGVEVSDLYPKAPNVRAEDDDRPTIDEVFRRHGEENERYIEASKKKWRKLVPVRPEPFAVAFIGDPHVENKGSNLLALRDDLELCRAAKIRCVNMGDILDNFHETGKLASKQAENRMSIAEGYVVAEWMMKGSGVKWDAHIIGNHDKWAGTAGGALFSEWAGQTGARIYDWIVEITYAWEGGKYTVLAAHDFKGSSIYNALHGPMRRALEDGSADLYVAAHRHEAAKADKEHGFRSRHYQFLRVRGYKDWDDYAHTRGFQQQEEGRSALAVINPMSETKEGRCRTFLDLAEGIEYLNMLRRRDGDAE